MTDKQATYTVPKEKASNFLDKAVWKRFQHQVIVFEGCEGSVCWVLDLLSGRQGEVDRREI